MASLPADGAYLANSHASRMPMKVSAWAASTPPSARASEILSLESSDAGMFSLSDMKPSRAL